MDAIKKNVKPIVILTLITILVGGATSRFYAYREPDSLILLLTHIIIALILYGVIIHKLYQHFKSQIKKPSLTLSFILFSLQLGLGSFLALYRLNFFGLGRLGELSFTGLHFLIALMLLIILTQNE